MKSWVIFVAGLVLGHSVFAQAPKSVTVPITLDHNRVIIDVYLPLKDGSTKRVRAWVVSAQSAMMMSQRMASLFGAVHCESSACTGPAPSEMLVGGMRIPLSALRTVQVPSGIPNEVMVPGMGAEISLPASILRNYDVVFDYANRQFTIGNPGAVSFKGSNTKIQIDSTGLVQVSGKIDGQEYSFRFDTGASMSFIESDQQTKWHGAHPAWPYMKGSVGPANMFGTPDETERELLRISPLQIGSSTLQDVLIANLSSSTWKEFHEEPGPSTAGLLGGDALRNYRVGIDYAHGLLYLEQIAQAVPPGTDVVPITLHPEPDGRYTVLAIVDYEGKAGVPNVKAGDVLLGVDGAPVTGATLGQVWSLLGGTPGQNRTLTFERDGKRFTVATPVRRFLPAASKTPRKSPRRNAHRGY